MEACIIVCSNAKHKYIKDKIRFVYATDLVSRSNGESFLTNEQINQIISYYHSSSNIQGRVAIVDKDTIANNDFSLFTKRYIQVPDVLCDFSLEESLDSWEDCSRRLRTELKML